MSAATRKEIALNTLITNGGDWEWVRVALLGVHEWRCRKCGSYASTTSRRHSPRPKKCNRNALR